MPPKRIELDKKEHRKQMMRIYSRRYEAKQHKFCPECTVPINRQSKFCRSCASKKQWERRRWKL